MKTTQSATLGATIILAATASLLGGDIDPPGRGTDRFDGEALFSREWLAGVPSPRGGDGLGPFYNETSCVACHNLGGVGGAGPASKNIDLVSASTTPEGGRPAARMGLGTSRREISAQQAKLTGREFPPARIPGQALDRAPLIRLHAGFRESSTVAVHRFGPDTDYKGWREYILRPEFGDLFFRVGRLGSSVSNQITMLQRSAIGRGSSLGAEYGHFTLTNSQLNPPALFGTGLIDAIPDAVLEAAAAVKYPEFLQIKGRVRRLRDGRIGRFGWKAQSGSLDEFVRVACAVELGLEVPGNAQAGDPRSENSLPMPLDLTREDCDALASFVRNLPIPSERRPPGQLEAKAVSAGSEAFRKIGCSACHSPSLGTVDGIYSDLLLHDMGNSIADTISYGVTLPDPGTASAASSGLPDAGFPTGPDAFAGASNDYRPASRREWRTPPLWGLRDSGPYLHDGRAETLEQAIAFHEGEAKQSARLYFGLSDHERSQIQGFLKTLTAPNPVGRAIGPR